VTALVAEGLVAGYGSTTVLRGVDLVVPSGAVVALLGANGAGKTTMLRALSGALPISAGSVRVGGEEVSEHPPHRRAAAGLALIPEGRGIFRELTVRENLALFAAAAGDPEGQERAVAAFPKLGQRFDQLAGTMSGGEQQMLALTRASIGPPAVVMFDEVSMGLAPVVVDEIFGFVSALSSAQTSMLLVEQYVHRALAVADYVYILDRGSINFAGEPSELAGEDVFERYLAGADAGAGA
jgi:branched-chain amino acid transport system ATP-binding protein